MSLLALLAACGPTPDDVSAGDHLFGLTTAEIHDAADRYGVDAADLLAQLAAPIDCNALGDLCNMVGPDAAEDILYEAWMMMEEGRTVDEIGTALSPLVDDGVVIWDEIGPDYRGSDESQSKSYTTNCSADLCKLEVRAHIYNALVVTTHKGYSHYWIWVENRVNPSYSEWSDAWGNTSGLDLDLTSKRTQSGSTSTRTCSNMSSTASTVSCYKNRATGGSHRATACGESDGHTICVVATK